MEDGGERLQAFCSITFDDAFVVRDLKIIEGATGPFVAMPSRKLTAHCPQCGCKNHVRASYCNQCGGRQREHNTSKDDDGRSKLYADIAHPINSACREMIQQRVIQAFEEEKARAQLPGYVPNYDDFDAETVSWSPAQGATNATASPTTMPTARPTSPSQNNSGHTHMGQAHIGQMQAAERPRGPHRPPTPQNSPQHSSQHSSQRTVRPPDRRATWFWQQDFRIAEQAATVFIERAGILQVTDESTFTALGRIGY